MIVLYWKIYQNRSDEIYSVYGHLGYVELVVQPTILIYIVSDSLFLCLKSNDFLGEV